MGTIPLSRPGASRANVEALLKSRSITLDKLIIVGVRGYYSNSFGKPGNDRGVFDDAFFLISPTFFKSFNGNVDPSTYRKHIAVLKAAFWKGVFKIGIHGRSKPKARQYEALIQAAPVTVIRDGEGPDTGMFGINNHHGSEADTTSSLGCQTVPFRQFAEYLHDVKDEMRIHSQSRVDYLLVEAGVQGGLP